MKKIAVIYGGNAHQHRTFRDSKYKEWFTDLLYLPEISSASFDQYDILIVPSQLNRKQLAGVYPRIQDFYQSGGTVVALGAQSFGLFEEMNWEQRELNFWWWLEKDGDIGYELVKPDHPLFDYISFDDTKWHYHGVFHPSPEAEVIIQTKDGGAVMLIERNANNGALLMTTLDPEYHYGSYFMPATERFLDGFLPWLAQGEL